MKSFLLCSALAALCCLFLRPSSEHPPPAQGNAPAGYASLSATVNGSCALDPNFMPVPHSASHNLALLLAKLTPAAGVEAEDYHIEMMRDQRGTDGINAMTCPDSRLIWVSVSAWEQLANFEPALALLLTHELAHANHRPVASLLDDAMLPAERTLLGNLSERQLLEVAADQRAADIMARAGYSAAQINYASWYILSRDPDGNLGKSSVSHPAGRDRANLLTYYLARRYVR